MEKEPVRLFTRPWNLFARRSSSAPWSTGLHLYWLVMTSRLSLDVEKQNGKWRFHWTWFQIHLQAVHEKRLQEKPWTWKNKPNVQNAFTLMTLNPGNQLPGLSNNWTFLLGFSEPTIRDFCQGNKNSARRKTIFPFRVRIYVKQRSKHHYNLSHYVSRVLHELDVFIGINPTREIYDRK